MGRAAGALIGALFFVWIAGTRALDPGEIGWLMRYDWPIHFFGCRPGQFVVGGFLVLGAVRHVEAHAIHARGEHRLQHAGLTRCRPNRGQNFCFSHNRCSVPATLAGASFK